MNISEESKLLELIGEKTEFSKEEVIGLLKEAFDLGKSEPFTPEEMFALAGGIALRLGNAVDNSTTGHKNKAQWPDNYGAHEIIVFNRVALAALNDVRKQI